MKSAIINPIKCYRQNEMPDNITHFPTMENVTFGSSYIYGLAFSPEFIRTHIGIVYEQFQFEITDINSMDIYKYQDGSFVLDDTITGTDISPVGWVGKPIYQFELDLADGCYYFEFPNQLRSDLFIVTEDEYITEDLVKIEYANSENDFGCIFDDGSNTYSFTAYFRGQLLAGQPGQEIESYNDDRGELVKLRATPQKTATLNIKGVHYLYQDYFIHLFSLDTISINGVEYENDEAPSFNFIEGADTGDMTIKLVQKNNDYYNG